MFTAIDHLVIVVPELEAAIHDCTAAGFTVTRGGRHDVGTYNVYCKEQRPNRKTQSWT